MYDRDLKKDDKTHSKEVKLFKRKRKKLELKIRLLKKALEITYDILGQVHLDDEQKKRVVGVQDLMESVSMRIHRIEIRKRTKKNKIDTMTAEKEFKMMEMVSGLK